MHISQKQKTFSEVFSSFLGSSLHFGYFETKDDAHRFCISKIMDSQNVVKETSKSSRLRGPMDKRHGKGAQALLKSAPQPLYHI